MTRLGEEIETANAPHTVIPRHQLRRILNPSFHLDTFIWTRPVGMLTCFIRLSRCVPRDPNAARVVGPGRITRRQPPFYRLLVKRYVSDAEAGADGKASAKTGHHPPSKLCQSQQSAESSKQNNNNVSMDLLKRMQADLIEADANQDGRIDYDELKAMLGKYPDAFSHDDVERIGELFYVGRSGTSVPHLTFLRGIQYVMRRNDKKESGRSNPLQMESLEDQRCWVSPEETAASGEDYYNIQGQFEQCLADYIKEVSSPKDGDQVNKK